MLRPEPVSAEEQLIDAASDGDLDRIRRLIKRGVDIETDASTTRTDTSGRTAFMAAVGSGNRDAAQLLLDLGADPQAQMDNGETAMHSAVLGGEPEIIPWLVELGLDVDEDAQHGPPLMQACTMFAKFGGSGEKVAAIKALIAAGADINKPGLSGITPLIGAALHRRDDLIPILVDAGADVTLSDEHGRTALYAGLTNTYGVLEPPSVTILIRGGADVDAPDKEGRTALLKSAQWGLPHQVQILLALGANPEARDNNGKSAFDLANERDGFSDSNFDAVIQILQDATDDDSSD